MIYKWPQIPWWMINNICIKKINKTYLWNTTIESFKFMDCWDFTGLFGCNFMDMVFVHCYIYRLCITLLFEIQGIGVPMKSTKIESPRNLMLLQYSHEHVPTVANLTFISYMALTLTFHFTILVLTWSTKSYLVFIFEVQVSDRQRN